MEKILISELLKKSSVITEKPVLINEQSFDYFARATTEVNGAKCIFVQNKKYLSQITDNVAMVITTKEIFDSAKNKTENNNLGFCLISAPPPKFVL